MKVSTEIYTSKVTKSKLFYTEHFDFEVKLEMEGFVVLQNRTEPAYELLFCVPNSPFVHPIFHPEFQGQDVLFQFEVENVEQEYARLKRSDLPIAVDLVDEEVNGRHFAIIDPNGTLIDIVSFSK
mgnify:CR=1 FL=1